MRGRYRSEVGSPDPNALVTMITVATGILGRLPTVRESIDAWVVLVTDGTALESAPEVFIEHELAVWSFENWGWFLSSGGAFPIERPFEDRLQIGHRDVRLIKTVWEGGADGQLWVGTHWTADGYPDPEATLLASFSAAKRWASTPLFGQPPDELATSPWHVIAIFRRGAEEETSATYAAKFVSNPELMGH
jgi:hypothetical protein